MKFKEFKNTLRFKDYSNFKIFTRYLEFKIKNFFYNFFILLNYTKHNKQYLNLEDYHDTRFINFLFFSLKKNFHFTYKKNKNTILFIKKIGLKNFIKHTCNIDKIKKNNNIINLKFNSSPQANEISFNTNYFNLVNKKNTEDQFFMPYYMYPEIYNSYYNKINIDNNIPKFKIFFSGGIYEPVYSKYKWIDNENNKKHLNRIEIINIILKEFNKEIFLVKNKNDLKTNKIFKKKIILCLHDRMTSKKKYILNFKENYNMLSLSAYNLNCPGVVMPICHHLVEGIKFGSIPITQSNNFLYPKIPKKLCVEYYDKNSLITGFNKALNVHDDDIKTLRQDLKLFYKQYLSPESFRNNFIKNLKKNKFQEIIACNDHESVKRLRNYL